MKAAIWRPENFTLYEMSFKAPQMFPLHKTNINRVIKWCPQIALQIHSSP